MPVEERARALYPDFVAHEVEVPDWRLEDVLRRSAGQFPDQRALIFYQRHWTYREFLADAQHFARALQDRGLKEGDRVALMLPNCPQYAIGYYGVLMAGGVVAQVNPLSVERELQYLLEDSGATMIIALDQVLPRVLAVQGATVIERVLGVSLGGTVALEGVEDFWEVLRSASSDIPEAPVGDNQAVAVLQYTGGTTGRSKGAMLTHRNLVANLVQILAYNPQGMAMGGESFLSVIPLFHIYGVECCLNLCVFMGGKLVLLPRFDVTEVLETIRDQHVTLWPGVPTMYVALLQRPDVSEYGVDSIRICNSGSAPMPVELMERFETMTGAAILEGYGLSETSPVTHTNPYWGVRKPGTVGLPMPSTEYRVVDPNTGKDLEPGALGEIWVRGPQVMKGYWNRPDETQAALVDGGWFRTGDLGSYDEEGYLSIMDRLKDLIIASGYNVYPREIEELLYQHPDIVEAVVVGAPDAYRGETVRAVIVPRPGSGLTVEQLNEYLARNLAAYKRPKMIEFRDSLPKSAVGKILRRVVRDEKRS